VNNVWGGHRLKARHQRNRQRDHDKDGTISFNVLLLLEGVQLSWFPGWLPETGFAIALRANPVVEWYMQHRCPEFEEGLRMGDLTDRGHQPSPEDIRLALGLHYPLWERLTRFIETNYQIEGEWSLWGPAKSGWNLRYRRKGRALVALYPQKGRVTAQVVLGKAQAERALSLKLGEKVGKMLREAPQLRDGRWLSVSILNEADAEDVERLLLVKMRPVRRME
jgi:hypothetical protein